MPMTLACAMQISKASEEVCSTCFKKKETSLLSKKHVPGTGHFFTANSLLLFANQDVSIVSARSDTNACLEDFSLGFLGGPGAKGKSEQVGLSPV